jgi:hypothetical protein
MDNPEQVLCVRHSGLILTATWCHAWPGTKFSTYVLNPGGFGYFDKHPAQVLHYYGGGCHNLQGRQKLTTGNTCTQVQCRCINLYISNFPLYSEGARACGPHARFSAPIPF